MANPAVKEVLPFAGDWALSFHEIAEVGEKNRLRGSMERKVYRPSLAFLGKLSPSDVVCLKP